MKLQTRVRQMLQWHFSFSKLAAFCVFNHFLHWLLPVLQCQEYWDKSFHDPKENLLRTGCLGAQRAKQTCPFGDRWPQLCFWLEGSQVALLRLCEWNHWQLSDGHIPNPQCLSEGSLQGFPSAQLQGFWDAHPMCWHVSCMAVAFTMDRAGLVHPEQASSIGASERLDSEQSYDNKMSHQFLIYRHVHTGKYGGCVSWKPQSIAS